MPLGGDGRMIYGMNGRVTKMVLRRLENQGPYDILMNGFSYKLPLLLRKQVKVLKMHYKKVNDRKI